jgi:regulator of protease activity HflC (stomatin/prohibitin superfamily)
VGNEADREREEKMTFGQKAAAWAIGAFVILMLGLWLAPFTSVNAGHIGLVLRGNRVVRTLQPGYQYKTPAIESVIEVDVRTQVETTSATAASKDLQTVNTKVAVNFNINPDKVEFMWNSVGKEYKTILIDPAIQEAVKSATAKHTAEELITQRQLVKDEITSALHDRLATSGFLNVTQVSITDFDFSGSFNAAIEAKATAVQNAEAAKNNLEKVKFEQQAVVEQAKAQAEAIKIQASAINAQGGADYVQLQAIKAWDGHLPTQMIPGSAVPFINLTK